MPTIICSSSCCYFSSSSDQHSFTLSMVTLCAHSSQEVKYDDIQGEIIVKGNQQVRKFAMQVGLSLCLSCS